MSLSRREAYLLGLLEAAIHTIQELGRELNASGRTIHSGSSELELMERQAVVEALAANGGNQKRAAAALGISPRVINYKMKTLGIPRRNKV